VNKKKEIPIVTPMAKTTECKRCGKIISKYLLSIQNKPDSTEWVRNGFCSHSCFAEFAESNQKPIVAEVITKPKATQKKRTKKQKVKLVAFLVEGKPGGMFSQFQRGIVFTHPLSDWEEKIRKDTGYRDAEVKIIQPKEWHPPKLGEVSSQEISNKYPAILDSVVKYLTHNDIGIKPSIIETGRKGVSMSDMSGKAFFLFKY